MSLQPYLSRQLVAILGQARRLLATLDPEVYAASPQPLASSAIGEHLRHVLDAIRCFANGAESGEIDYDKRERDERTERDEAYAIERIDELCERLLALGVQESDALRVRADAPDDTEASVVSSSVGRELMYLVNHSIHHYAIIAMVLRHNGIEPAEDFGIAPSTLRYWKEVGRCAPQPG